MLKCLCFITLTAFLFVTLTLATEIDVNDPQNIRELYLVAPQGRLYRAKRQYGGYGGLGGGFGASAANAGSNSFNYSPQGFNAAQSLSGSQSYDFGGHHLSVGYAGSYSANQDGVSGSFAPTYSFT